MGERGGAYRVLEGRLERTFEELGVDSRIILKCIFKI
jgi:hypothetical protein